MLVDGNLTYTRLKSVLKEPLVYGLNESATEDNPDWPRYIRITDFDDNNNLSNETFKSLPIEVAQNALLKDGDILFARSGATVGKTFLYRDLPNGACYAGYLIRARLNKKVILPEYLSFLTKTKDYIEWKNRICTLSTIQNISAEKYNQLPLAIPSLEGQRRIIKAASALSSRIDSKISCLSQKIKALENLKKSIVLNSVLSGLSSYREKKYSGVDWLGDIPCNWSVTRIKELFAESKSVSISGQEDLLSVSEYYGVAKRSDKMTEDEQFETRADSLIGYKICHPGDLVINIMLAWKTGLGISEYYGIVSPAYAVYKGKNIVPKYYHYLLRTNLYTTQFKRSSKGIIDSRLRMYTDRFNNIPAIVPPIDEQKAIADYLDEKCSKIDKAIELTEKQIRKYKDLKIALIDKLINTPGQCD